MNNKIFLSILGVMVLGVIGFAIGSKPEAEPNNFAEEYKESPLSIKSEDRFLTDSQDKSVTLYEYSDFECPACVSVYPFVAQLKETYKDDINFVFRHFPLTNIHQKSACKFKFGFNSET